MSIYLETAKKQIEKGTVGLDAIKSNLTRHIEAENKAKWLADMRTEYDTLFKTVEVFIGDVSDGFTYVEDCPTFEEWISETKTVLIGTEIALDDNEVEYEKEIFEEQLVRPYVAVEVTETEIDTEYKKYATPKVVTMRQARLALLQSGLLATIETAIKNGTDEAMKIEWEYATEIKRDWSSLIALATSLNMTSSQLDDLFILAGTL